MRTGVRSLGRALGWVALCFAWSLSLAQSQGKGDATVPQNSIENIQVAQIGGNTIIKVTTRNPLGKVPANFSVANPARVSFDFPATGNGLGRVVQQINEGDLISANIVQVGERTRLVLNLRRSVPYETVVNDNILQVTLTQAADAQRSSSASSIFSEPKMADEPPTQIQDIQFRRGKNGEALIITDLSNPNVGIDIRQQGTSLVVDFSKTRVPEHLRRRLDVTDFATPVTGIATAPQGEGARITITPRGLWEHNAYQSDNRFVVEVKQVVEDPNKLVQGTRPGYLGENLSLNFQNVEVRSVLQVISDFTGFNIVVSDSVSGNLTLRLKDVPWDQALDIILQARGLDMRKNGNVIWIAPRDELAAKEKLELESRQQITDLELTRTESFQLNYHKAKSVSEFLKNKDNSMLSKRGAISIDERSNKLFITDTPSRLTDVRKLIKEIDVPVRQVMIEARIVDADEGFAKKLGVRLGGQDYEGLVGDGHRVMGNRSMKFGLSATAADANLNMVENSTNALSYLGGYIDSSTLKRKVPFDSATGLSNMQFVNLPIAGAAGSINLSLFNSNKTQMLSLELSALESDNRGKTLSNPRVLTADQTEAHIEAGDEIPYLQATSSGATSVAFKKATLSLKVRPQITPDGRIMMSLDIHKDKIGQDTAAGPAINTKQVKTEVLVDNGGTVVIGGIYTQDERNDITRTPFLGELPYVGFLFRKTEKVDTRTELLIFITPKIMSSDVALNQ